MDHDAYLLTKQKQLLPQLSPNGQPKKAQRVEEEAIHPSKVLLVPAKAVPSMAACSYGQSFGHVGCLQE